ncbi:hypothetical protein NDI47_20115 [Microcoleus vaginatus GB1-A2]|uniref:hypothetical protein n=1 Tax=Microcoleus vaginatus TaxID=119532 RepID=UPI001682ABEA|nr:hypothetical protein [Microcoleus sp. FACHB-61]
MSWVVKQTGNVLRRAVQFFQGESGKDSDYAPAIQGIAIAYTSNSKINIWIALEILNCETLSAKHFDKFR